VGYAAEVHRLEKDGQDDGHGEVQPALGDHGRPRPGEDTICRIGKKEAHDIMEF